MPLSAQVDLGLPVTRAMQPVQTAVRCDQTVQQALEDLRTRRIGHHIVYVYALGAGGRLAGVLPIRTLLRCLDPRPPQEVLERANQLRYRDFLVVGLIVDKEELFPDNWIYIHAPEVKVGRIQNFKNWSPDMVPDPTKNLIGLEYFVQEGDDLWTASDEELLERGRRECAWLGLVDEKDVTGGTGAGQVAQSPLLHQHAAAPATSDEIQDVDPRTAQLGKLEMTPDPTEGGLLVGVSLFVPGHQAVEFDAGVDRFAGLSVVVPGVDLENLDDQRLHVLDVQVDGDRVLGPIGSNPGGSKSKIDPLLQGLEVAR